MLACKSDRRTFVRVVAAVAGAALLFSPYIFGFGVLAPEAVSAFVLGFLIFTVNMSMAVDDRRRTDVATVALGAACLGAPALGGFPEAAAALWIHGAVGVTATLVGSYALLALSEPRTGSAAEPA